MSWSVNGIGKPAAVATRIAKQITDAKCAEPEESIKNAVGVAIAMALAAFPPGYAVKVDASGSQYAPDHTKPGEVSNTLQVNLSSLGPFSE